MTTQSNASPPDFEPLPPRWQAAWRWGAFALTLAAIALLLWKCLFNPQIRFLAPGPGSWIVYPMPAGLGIYPAPRLTATFRRSFVLTEKPASAWLAWRCCTNGEVLVNNTLIPPPDPSAHWDWKVAARADVAPILHVGTNEISVLAASELGPPAISLELKSENFSLESDENWAVSISGSAWRSAQSASATPLTGVAFVETPGEALRRCWPGLCLFAAISIFGVALFHWRFGPKWVPPIVAAAWVLLFLHNYPSVPIASGFDAPQHLEYVGYIQEHHHLPGAGEGWETFQPPLYYRISAGLLNLFHSRAVSASGMTVLRYLSLAIGTANLALVFAGLRLLFPGDWKKPLAGLALAAFLPAQICLLHYTTNETLSAMFLTGALALGIYLLRTPRPRPGWCVVLGITLGLALMSKASAVLALPAILGALAVKLASRRERSLRVWLGVVGVPLLLCLSIGGWHYFKLWQEYGNPLMGSWNPKMFTPWWQNKGFHTPEYFLSFGQSLTHPFFSSLHSFWDALYSTLWGDGLWSGQTGRSGRPPWNYDWMALGFVLALVPTALVLTGLIRALAMCWRAASLPWIMLLAFGWLVFFALVEMNLELPYYALAKAFYGLPALLPFCALGALGFEFWTQGRVARHLVGAALGIWMMNVYASFWIRPETEQSLLSSATAIRQDTELDASPDFLKVLREFPHDSQASIGLASLESKAHPGQAVARLEQALKEDPDNAKIETALAWDLSSGDHLDEAIRHAKRAIEMEPENAGAYEIWRALALRQRNFADAISAGREALGLNPTELKTHFNLGMALMNLGQVSEAARQFSVVLSANPEWAEAQFCLGRCLLPQAGERQEAIRHLREAVRLEPGFSDWQTALQNALQAR